MLCYKFLLLALNIEIDAHIAINLYGRRPTE